VPKIKQEGLSIEKELIKQFY